MLEKLQSAYCFGAGFSSTRLHCKIDAGGGVNSSGVSITGKGLAATNRNQQIDGGGSDGGSDGGGGGGGGGGGYSSGPSAAEKKAADALAAVVNYNAGNLLSNYQNTLDAYDTADKQNQNLRNTQVMQAKQSAAADWFPQHLKLQRTQSYLNDASGNSMRGSFLYDMRDALAAEDDLIDQSVLSTMRENTNSVLNSYFESLASLNNSRNDAAASTEQGLKELYADYVAQLVNINPDLASSYITDGNLNGTGADWLKSDFYNQNKVAAATPETQSLYRPDQANETARSQGILSNSYNTASSAVKSYWDRMNAGYDQRARQA